MWLAFHWNCHQSSNASNASSQSDENKNTSFSGIHINLFSGNSSNNKSSHDSGAEFSDELFILKRIMVSFGMHYRWLNYYSSSFLDICLSRVKLYVSLKGQIECYNIENFDLCGQVERGPAVYLSGLREKHFGEIFLNASVCLGGLLSTQTSRSPLEESQSDFYGLLETNESAILESEITWDSESTFPNNFKPRRSAPEDGLNHIARYVESFESLSNDIWLVFRHEGVSLSKLMYTVEEAENYTYKEKVDEVKHIQVLRPSKWWHWLKTTEAGKEEMRNLIWQLVCVYMNFKSNLKLSRHYVDWKMLFEYLHYCVHS